MERETFTEATYQVLLYLNGKLIGNVRELAENLTWVRRRTISGVDEIDFTINDVLFQKWCVERGTTIKEMLKPMALDCRVVRNGVELVGGFLATMPAYQPRSASASLALRFDGYLNYLAGVYIYPIGTVTGAANTVVSDQIKMAEARATAAGKGFGLKEGRTFSMPQIQQTFDNYISVKDFIANRSDNTTGAGVFDVYFHADKTYEIVPDTGFGDTINDYTIYYPMRLNNVAATSITAQEVSGYASTVIGIGAGEVSSDSTKNTAITNVQTNAAAVSEYGYAETILQESSVSHADTLSRNVANELTNRSSIIWEPMINLTGRQVAPTPFGTTKIWVGDRIQVVNTRDMTGTMSGWFRVNELSVRVSASGAETITPTLARIM